MAPARVVAHSGPHFHFLFDLPSSRHSCPLAWVSGWLVATFGGFRVAVLVCNVRMFTYCRMGSPGITVIRRMTLRVQVFLEIFYWLALTFAKAPGTFGSRGE